MEKILFVNACVRPESRTAGLARYLLEKMEGQVTELKLGDEDIRTLDLESLNRRNDLIEKKEFSDDMFRYARQFGTVDTVVIAFLEQPVFRCQYQSGSDEYHAPYPGQEAAGSPFCGSKYPEQLCGIYSGSHPQKLYVQDSSGRYRQGTSDFRKISEYTVQKIYEHYIVQLYQYLPDQ